MKNKKLRNRVILIVLVVVGIFPIVMSVLPKPETDIAAQYLTETVATQDLTIAVNGNGQITSIDSQNPMAVVLVSEYDIAHVRLAQRVQLSIGAFDQTIQGKVDSISDSVDTSTGVRTYSVSIELNKVPKGTRVGMSASAEVITSIKTGVVAIPVVAVSVVSDQQTVEVLRGNAVVTVPVQLGDEAGSLVEVTTGLSVGDVVVVGTNGEVPTIGGSGGFLPPSPEGALP